MGQHLQGHILEGAGGAVPQLQAVGVAVHRMNGGHRRGIELVRAVGGVDKIGELLHGKFIQKLLHHIHCPLLIGHIP